jgi:hypothetical protein
VIEAVFPPLSDFQLIESLLSGLYLTIDGYISDRTEQLSSGTRETERDDTTRFMSSAHSAERDHQKIDTNCG